MPGRGPRIRKRAGLLRLPCRAAQDRGRFWAGSGILAAMPMTTAEFNKRVQDWINERWPPDNPCPMCHTTSGWELSAPAQMPIRTDVVETPPGRAIAVVTLTCARCAFVVPLNAVYMGLTEAGQSAATPGDER